MHDVQRELPIVVARQVHSNSSASVALCGEHRCLAEHHDSPAAVNDCNRLPPSFTGRTRTPLNLDAWVLPSCLIVGIRRAGQAPRTVCRCRARCDGTHNHVNIGRDLEFKRSGLFD